MITNKGCSCGAAWDELEWCELHNEVCALGDYCAMNVFSKAGCAHRKDRLRCKKCGVMVDIQ